MALTGSEFGRQFNSIYRYSRNDDDFEERRRQAEEQSQRAMQEYMQRRIQEETERRAQEQEQRQQAQAEAQAASRTTEKLNAPAYIMREDSVNRNALNSADTYNKAMQLARYTPADQRGAALGAAQTAQQNSGVDDDTFNLYRQYASQMRDRQRAVENAAKPVDNENQSRIDEYKSNMLRANELAKDATYDAQANNERNAALSQAYQLKGQTKKSLGMSDEQFNDYANSDEQRMYTTNLDAQYNELTKKLNSKQLGSLDKYFTLQDQGKTAENKVNASINKKNGITKSADEYLKEATKGLSKEDLDKVLQYGRNVHDANRNQDLTNAIYKNTHTDNNAVNMANQIAGNAASVFVAPVTGIMSGVNALSGARNGYVNNYGGLNALSNFTNDVRNNTSQDIYNWEYNRHGETAAKLLSGTYQAGMSAADSMWSGVIGSEAVGALGLNPTSKAAELVQDFTTLPNMAAGAAAQQFYDYQEQGMDTKKAVLLAGINGAVEWITEKVPLNNLLEMSAQKGGKGALKRFLKQLASETYEEGAEEVAGDLLDTVADIIANGNQSDFLKERDSYVDSGMSMGQATAEASKNYVGQLVSDFAGGALGGALGGGIYGGMNLHNAYRQGREVFNSNDAQDFRDLSEGVVNNTGNEDVDRAAQEFKTKAENIADRLEKGEKVSTDERAELAQDYQNLASVDEGNNSVDVEEKQPDRTLEISDNDVPEQYRRQAANVDDVRNAIANATTASDLADAGKMVDTLSGDEQAEMSRMLTLKQQGLEMSGKVNRADVQAEYNTPSQEDVWRYAASGERLDEDDVNNLSDANKIAYNEGLMYNESTIASQRVTAQELRTNDLTGKLTSVGNKVQIEGRNGESADLNNIAADLPDNVRRAYAYAGDKATVEAGNLFLSSMPKDVPLTSYSRYFDMLYHGGTTGQNMNSALNDAGILKQYMPVSQMKAIYEQGVSDRQAALEAEKQNFIAPLVKGQQDANGSWIIDNRTNKNVPIAEKELYEAMGAKLGVNIELTDKLADGINGEFNRNLSKIVLNVKSNKAFSTLSHEGIGEFLTRYNKEDLNDIRSTVMDYIRDTKGSDYFTEMGNRYFSTYRQYEGDKSLIEAYGEMVNDAIGGVFSTEEGQKDLANWLAESKTPKEATTFREKVKNFFDGIINALHNLVTKSSLPQASRLTAQMAEDNATKLRSQILSAMDKAIENYQNTAVAPQGQTQKQDTKFSVNVDENQTGIKPLEISDNDLNENIHAVHDMDNVATVEFYHSPNMSHINEVVEDVLAKSKDWNTNNPDLGTIEVNRSGLKEVLHHSNGSGIKTVILNAIPEVIQSGKIVAADRNHDKGGYNTATLAAPIRFTGEGVRNVQAGDYYVAVVAKRDFRKNRNKQTLHVTDVLSINKTEAPALGDAEKIAPFGRDTNEKPQLHDILTAISQDVNYFEENSDKVKYSVEVDSDGKKLTEDQQKYFTDSKVTDENGTLKVMYHGTESAGFNNFDPDAQVSGKAFFFTDSLETAKGYSGNSDIYAPQKFVSTLAVENQIARVTGNNEYTVKKENGGKYVLYDDGEFADSFDNLDDVYGGWLDYSGYGGTAANYKVYLNATNPYVVDAKNENWDRLPGIKGYGNTTNAYVDYARDNGYDSVMFNNITDGGLYSSAKRMNTPTTVVAVFNPNQIKSVNNLHPSNDDDIRYSVSVDDSGKPLTEGQRKYFDKTKVVDDSGALKTMYHGTENADFTVFDPAYSDDHISLFFTDSPAVAASYSSSKDVIKVDTPKAKTLDDLKNFISDKGWDVTVEKRNGEYVLVMPHGDEIFTTKSFGALRDEVGRIANKYPVGGASNYAVYLNIKNPLVIESGDDMSGKADYVTLRYTDGVVSASFAGDNGRGSFTFPADSFIEANEKYFNNDPNMLTAILDVIKDGGRKEIDDVYVNYHTASSNWNDIDFNGGTTNTRGIAQYAKQHGYDGVILKNLVDIGYYGMMLDTGDAPSTIAIAFDSNQVKSVNNLDPTTDEDIRYSLDIPKSRDVFGEDENGFMTMDDDSPFPWEEYEEPQQKEAAAFDASVSILEEGAEALKGQTVDMKLVNRIAREFAKGTDIKATKLAENMAKIFAYMQDNRNFIDYNDMMRLATEVMQPVVDATLIETGDRASFNQLKDSLKGYSTIKLTPDQIEAIDNAVGYKQFTGSLLGILKFSKKNGQSLDGIYSEIANLPGMQGLVDENVQEAEQPLQIYDAINAERPRAKRLADGSTNNGDNQTAAYDMALQFLAEYYEEAGKKMAQTDGQKADERLKNFKQRMREQNAEYRKAVRQKYNDRLKAGVNEAKAHAENRYQERIERQKRNTLKQDISNRVKSIMDMMEHPTDEKHVVEALKEPLADFISTIDFVTPEIRQYKTGKNKGKFYARVFDHMENSSPVYHTIVGDTQGEVYRLVNTEIERQLQNNAGSKDRRTWQEKMRNMITTLHKSQSEAAIDTDLAEMNLTIDPSLVWDLEDVIARNNKVLSVSQLDSTDLDTLSKFLSNIETVINHANKFYTDRIDMTVRAAAQDFFHESEKHGTYEKPGKVHTKAYDMLYNLTNVSMLTPYTFMTTKGTGASAMFDDLRAGRDRRTERIREAENAFKGDILKDVSNKEIKDWRENARTIYVTESAVSEKPIKGAKTVTFSDAQIMSLYELMKRPDAWNHLPGGFRSGRKNGSKMVIDSVSHLNNAELNQVFSLLNPKQKEVANKVQNFLATNCADWNNYVSMMLYGYKKYVDPAYFPMETDSDTIALSDKNSNNLINAIANQGFTKSVNRKATNALMVYDIFDVAVRHISNSATYNGYATSIADLLKWWNYKEYNKKDNGDIDIYSVKGKMRESYGRGSAEYIPKLIMDLNGQIQDRTSDAKLSETLLSHYKAAAVGANLRVAIQQPTAIMRSMATMNPEYVLQAQLSLPQAKKLAEYAQEHNSIAYWKSHGYYDTSMGQSMEQIITGQSSVFETIKDKTSILAQWGDDATWGILYKAVELETADKNKDLDQRTTEFRQKVNDRFNEVIDQTQVVDGVLERSQFMRSQNAFVKMESAFQAEPTKSYNMLYRAVVSGSKGKIARAAATFIGTAILTSLAAAVMDALRNPDDDKKWYEVYNEKLKENVVDNLNVLSLFPYVKDVFNLVEGYDIQRMDTQGIADFIQAAQNVVKKAQGEGTKTTYGTIKSLVKAFSELTGVPFYGAMREVETVNNNAARYLGVGQKWETRQETSSQKKDAQYRDLVKAIDKGGDANVQIRKLIGKEGTDGKPIRAQDIYSYIMSTYKEDYVNANDTDRKELKEKILKAVDLVGDKKKAEETIKGWESGETSSSDTYGTQIGEAINNGESTSKIISEMKKEGYDKEQIVDRIRSQTKSNLEYYYNNDKSKAVAYKQRVIDAIVEAGYPRSTTKVNGKSVKGANERVNTWLGLDEKKKK